MDCRCGVRCGTEARTCFTLSLDGSEVPKRPALDDLTQKYAQAQAVKFWSVWKLQDRQWSRLLPELLSGAERVQGAGSWSVSLSQRTGGAVQALWGYWMALPNGFQTRKRISASSLMEQLQKAGARWTACFQLKLEQYFHSGMLLYWQEHKYTFYCISI